MLGSCLFAECRTRWMKWRPTLPAAPVTRMWLDEPGGVMCSASELPRSAYYSPPRLPSRWLRTSRVNESGCASQIFGGERQNEPVTMIPRVTGSSDCYEEQQVSCRARAIAKNAG